MTKELEIEQDHKFQKTSWKLQKAGTIFIILVILTALTGLIGSGPLSFRKINHENISIEYPAITRFSHPEQIKIRIYNPEGDTIKLLISRSYLSEVNIDGIIPEPVEESVYMDYIQFSFLLDNNYNNDILFDLQFRTSLNLKGEWGIKDKDLITINHFIFP